MAARSGISTMLAEGLAEGLVQVQLTAGNDLHHDRRNRPHQTELRTAALCVSGAVLLLLGHGVRSGSDSAVYDVPRRRCVVAAKLAVDARADVIWGRLRTIGSVSLQ